MIMMTVAGLIGGLGIVCILWRKTVLGLLVGAQLVILGSSMIFVLAGIISGFRASGNLFALFVLLGGVSQLVCGLALSIRLFYLRGKIEMADLESLKQ
jgi:NADH:ubiquinone oxidoreductase subunit K